MFRLTVKHWRGLGKIEGRFGMLMSLQAHISVRLSKLSAAMPRVFPHLLYRPNAKVTSQPAETLSHPTALVGDDAVPARLFK